MSILTGRSECPHCKHTLAWFDLIPVLSFILLGGKCHYCKKPISWQYPLVEIATSFLVTYGFYLAYLQRNSGAWAAALIVAFLFFITVSVIDIQTLEIPLEYALAAALVAGGVGLLTDQLTWQSALWGMGLGAGILAVILYGWKFLFKQDGMGIGDVWLGGCIGFIVGYPNVIIALMSAFTLGAIISIGVVGFSRKNLAKAVPFGPFLFLGMLVALQWGPGLIHWYSL